MVDESGFFFVSSAKETWGAGTPERIGGSLTGWSEVWLVERDGKYRVLKSLKPDFRGLPLYEGLLKKEFDIGFSLNHSNICETYAFFEHPTLGNCIEMEWVDGRSLEAIKAECRKDSHLARKLILEICDALICVHSKQMVHQDLKPSNILVTHNGNNVKIIDFGLSIEDSQSELKLLGGTKAYAAPELLEGKKSDVRSDIYSLGKVIGQISPRYRSIIRRCCKQNPDERFLSVADVRKSIIKMDSGMSWVMPVAIAAAAAIVAVMLLVIRGGGETSQAGTAETVSLAAEASASGQNFAEFNGQTSNAEIKLKQDNAKTQARPAEKEKVKSSEQAKAAEPAKKIEAIEDETDLDDIFDSVTGLFEEKEDGK